MKDTVVFTFGRFNPPTTGHEKLIEKVVAVAKTNGADYMIFPSHSQNPKKDPLSHKDKVNFMKKMFPKYARNIINNKNAKTAFHIVPMLYEMGYKKCIMVVGGDRVTEFDTSLNKYNGIKGKHGFYNFDGGVDIISAGERDPDAEGVTGMSASKMRAAAAVNDYDSFKNGLPSRFEKRYGKNLFDSLRDAMNISEELKEFLDAVNFDFSNFINNDLMEYIEDADNNELFESVYEEFYMERKTAQDKDVEDRKGTQPKKYYAKDADGDEMSKSTKVARARHFSKQSKKPDDKDSSYKPAPGDKGAKTKLSKHTKKYRQMFGEKVTRADLFKLYNKAMKLPAGSPAHDKITKEIAKTRKILTRNKVDIAPPSTALGRKFKLVKAEEINLDELVSRSQLNDLEKFADRMLAKLDIDVSFTKHFLDRLNDKRNDPEIKVSELQRFFKKILNKKGSQIKSNPNIQAVLKDVTANLNLPVVINYNNGKFEVVHKTIMRKKNFTTSNKELKYEKLDPDKDDAGDYIKDFRKSKAPQFKGKSDKKIQKMAIAAYLSAKEKSEETNPRIPRKKGQPANSDKHSDLYTDENPKGTIKGLKFATVKDAQDSVSKIENSGKKHAHKIQAAIAMEQRARVMNKISAANVYRKYINDMKKKTKEKNEADGCWDGYKRIGGKMKNGKMVPNCVPEGKEDIQLGERDMALDKKINEISNMRRMQLVTKIKNSGVVKKGSMSKDDKKKKEEVELDEMKEPFVVVDTADGDKVVGMASSEKGAKQIITTAQLPPMKIKDKKTLKIVKVKKKQMIGRPIKEEVELDEAKISMKNSAMQYYYVDPNGVVQGVGSKDAMRKMNVKQAKDGNKGGHFSQNFKKYKVGDKIKEELDENKRAALAKKLSKASASTKKGKEKVTLKKAPWEKKEAANPAQQAAIAIAKKKSGKYDEDGKRKKENVVSIYKKITDLEEKKITGLVKKSEKSGISYGILKKVYDRGMAAWKGGHRPGTTPQQWAFARVNSFITGGGARKADNDLWQKR